MRDTQPADSASAVRESGRTAAPEANPQSDGETSSADAFLTHDFCPWANRWFYWMKQPFAALSLAAAMAACCGFFVGPFALVPLAGLLLVLFLGYAWPTIAVRGLSCSLSFDRSRATEGRSVTVRLRIENRLPFPVWGLSLERGFGAADEAAVLALAQVPGRATTEFEWEFEPPMRGVYPEQESQLVTGFPFGLRKASRVVEFDGTLLVRPRLFKLDTLLDSADVRPSEDILSEERIGDAGDMMGTRPFRDGDSLRRVHWGQTARHGKLVVCERQAPALSAVRVLLDVESSRHVGSGPGSTLEWSIRLAASLCAVYHGQHAHVDCRIGNELVSIGGRPDGMERFLDRLARIPREGTNGGAWSARGSRGQGLTIFVGSDLVVHPHVRDRSRGGDLRTVVLRAAAFDRRSPPVEGGDCGCRPTIALDEPGAVETQFRKRWERLCRVG